MAKIFAFLFLCCPLFHLLAQSPSTPYSLNDFFRYHPQLNEEVEALFDSLSEEARVGQLIVQAAGRLGKPKAEVVRLVNNQQVGGILLLNGEKEELTALAKELDSLSMASGGLPLLFSADAEPSLVNRKIAGTRPSPKTNRLEDAAQTRAIARQISEDLKDIGILHNFAPVVDISPNNAAIGNRTFGNDSARVVPLSNAFIQASQEAGIAATAKHFPGHGLVQGDTHHKLVYIDGEMQEVSLYQPLIDSGVISIMVAHIAVENNEYATDGLPATCSPAIVSDLLKGNMGFRGIVVTDAMRMGAVGAIPHGPLKAVQAGCDMILMPDDEPEMIQDVLAAMEEDPAFRRQVDISVKKILRLKLCLGVIGRGS